MIITKKLHRNVAR